MLLGWTKRASFRRGNSKDHPPSEENHVPFAQDESVAKSFSVSISDTLLSLVRFFVQCGLPPPLKFQLGLNLRNCSRIIRTRQQH